MTEKQERLFRFLLDDLAELVTAINNDESLGSISYGIAQFYDLADFANYWAPRIHELAKIEA